MHSLQVENGLSVAHASHFSHLHGEAVELQKRVCPFPQVVVERRMEKGLGHNIEPLQVFLGHVQCGYQGRKKRTTTNAIYVADRQGIPLAMSTPVSDFHNDLHNISQALQNLFAGLRASGLAVS